MREYPVRLPLPFPDEAYIDPNTFNRSLTSSACHWERTKGIHADWGKLNKSQNSVLTKMRSLVEDIDKLSSKLSYEDQAFYNEFNNYLISIMPYVASHRPNKVPVQSMDTNILPMKGTSNISSLITKLQ